MAVLWFDSSSLVRRYDVDEPGSELVIALCTSVENQIYLSSLARLELVSAFQRKRHEGVFTPERLERVWRTYQNHERDVYQLIGISNQVLARAEELLRNRHPLRAADAIHVASALELRAGGGVPGLRFVTADRRQANAAEAEGLAVQLVG